MVSSLESELGDEGEDLGPEPPPGIGGEVHTIGHPDLLTTLRPLEHAMRVDDSVEVIDGHGVGHRVGDPTKDGVVGVDAGSGVLWIDRAIRSRWGIEVGQGEEDHSGALALCGGDHLAKLGGQVGVPRGLPDVHPDPIVQMVDDLPATKEDTDDLWAEPIDRSSPVMAPVHAPLSCGSFGA